MLSPSELVNYALERGVDLLGIADHDSTEGLADAIEAARGTGLTVVPGVELNTDVSGGEAHVLGYLVEAGPGAFQEQLKQLRAARFERGRKMVEQLNAARIPIKWERVQEIAKGGAVGRPHVAQALVEAGYALTTSDAFDRLIGAGKVGYVARTKFTPADAVRAIRAAGGVPVLAHPLYGAAFSAGSSSERSLALARLGKLLDELIAAGLKGLEVYYDGYDPTTVRELERVAEARGLVATGGSDFHGQGRGHGDLGTAPIPPHVAETLLLDLQAAAAAG